MKAPARWGNGFAVGLAIGVQFLPLGHPRTNPPVTNEVAWPDTTTRALFIRACGDCHSNETRWPWYSRIAPVSWTVTGHVRHGRGTLNVSEWSEERFGDEARLSGQTLDEGTMPIPSYLRFHSQARLSEEETAHLKRGLELAFRQPDSSAASPD
ncbi:MAG: hypothetical protein Rubg2KO_06680 [Rubricoccaceae bacterium]